MSPSPALQLQNVRRSFGKFEAVKDLSFDVRPGEVLGFLGPNGAGKTSTLRMILGILKPDAGTVSLFGANWTRDALARVGYLPEERGLYKTMKAISAVSHLGMLRGMGRGAARKKARQLLERFGLGGFAYKRISSLSKGMAQKVQLAAAIVHDPGLLILDEPFSGLDPLNQQVLEDVIREQAAAGHAVLFSTHTMQHAERLCERLLILDKGAMRFEGTLAKARAAMPRRVRIEADGDMSFLARVHGVTSVTPPHGAEPVWEVHLELGADPRAILAACFEAGVALRRFDASEASLHEIFVSLVGAQEDGE